MDMFFRANAKAQRPGAPDAMIAIYGDRSGSLQRMVSPQGSNFKSGFIQTSSGLRFVT